MTDIRKGYNEQIQEAEKLAREAQALREHAEALREETEQLVAQGFFDKQPTTGAHLRACEDRQDS